MLECTCNRFQRASRTGEYSQKRIVGGRWRGRQSANLRGTFNTSWPDALRNDDLSGTEAWAAARAAAERRATSAAALSRRSLVILGRQRRIHRDRDDPRLDRPEEAVRLDRVGEREGTILHLRPSPESPDQASALGCSPKAATGRRRLTMRPARAAGREVALDQIVRGVVVAGYMDFGGLTEWSATLSKGATSIPF
jgi:hypothetical protein